MIINDLKRSLSIFDSEMPVILEDEHMYNQDFSQKRMTYRYVGNIYFDNICEYGSDTTGTLYLSAEDTDTEKPYKVLCFSWENEPRVDLTVGKLIDELNCYNGDMEAFISNNGPEDFHRSIKSFGIANIAPHSGSILIQTNEKISDLTEENMVIYLSGRDYSDEMFELIKKILDCKVNQQKDPS